MGFVLWQIHTVWGDGKARESISCGVSPRTWLVHYHFIAVFIISIAHTLLFDFQLQEWLSLPTYFIFVYEIVILSSIFFFMEWVSWCILPAHQTFQWDVSLCLQFDYGQAFFVSSNFFLRSFASSSGAIRTTTCLQPLLQYKFLKERGYLDKLNLIKLKKIVETLSIYYETTNKL